MSKRKITIVAGACGETIEAEAQAEDGRYANLRIIKCCEHVERMKAALEKEPLDAYKLMAGFASSPIYHSAGVCLPHVTCPVPSGLHKLIEVVTGLAVPVDVTITFDK